MINSQVLVLGRWCGQPQGGKAYVVIDRKYLDGNKIVAHMIDPPTYVPEEAGFTSIATNLVPRVPKQGQNYIEVENHLGQIIPCAVDFFGNPIWDILDTVGSTKYTVVKFLEEVKLLGFHQLVPRTLDFAALSPESKYLVMHDEAIVEYPNEHRDCVCPKQLGDHQPCIGMAWETDKKPVGEQANGEKFAARERTGKEVFSRGIFAAFPIGALAQFRVYQDLGPEQMHLKVLEALDSLDDRLKHIEFIPMQ